MLQTSNCKIKNVTTSCFCDWPSTNASIPATQICDLNPDCLNTTAKNSKDEKHCKPEELILIGFFLLMLFVAYFANETDEAFINNRKETQE